MPWWGWLLVVFGVALCGLAVAGLLAARDRRLRALIEAVEEVGWRRGLRAVWALARDPRVPWFVRLLPVPLVLYLVFPIDLIPDMIPVIGQLDDILIAAAALWVVVRFTPWAVLREHLGLPAESIEALSPDDGG